MLAPSPVELCCESPHLSCIQEDEKYQCMQESDLVPHGNDLFLDIFFSFAHGVVCADLVRIVGLNPSLLKVAPRYSQLVDSIQFLAMNSNVCCDGVVTIPHQHSFFLH